MKIFMIIRSALTPLRESVTALPAPAYWQEGEASSRLARDVVARPVPLLPVAL